MTDTLSKLVQDIYFELGQSEAIFTVTGGSTTTAIDTTRGDLDSPPDADRNKNDYLVVVEADGAVPEGEWSRITDYNDSTYTYTFAALTAALAAGDSVMILKQSLFKLFDVVRAINNAFEYIGDIPYIDTSLTTGANQTEYAYPVTLKRNPPFAVLIQTFTDDADDNQYAFISGWRYEPALGGSTGLLITPQLAEGRKLKLLVNTIHPELTTYSSKLYEGLNRKLVVEAAIANLLMRANSSKRGKDEFWTARETDARREVERLKKELKPWRMKGKRYAEYGRGSGLRYPGDQTALVR